MSRYTTYKVILRDGDGQPLDSYDAWGMKEVRERISIAREDYSHYGTVQFIVTDERGVCVIDRTYKNKVAA